MTGPHWQVPLDEDYHVHSTFSDGASTLAENVRAARERGLRTLCLVDHVRRDTSWLPAFTAAVARYRQQPGLHVLAGVEAKILDTSGQLDLPPGLLCSRRSMEEYVMTGAWPEALEGWRRGVLHERLAGLLPG